MSRYPSTSRSLATALLAAGAVVVPSAAALAADTGPGQVSMTKSQIEYNERQATQDELLRSYKAKIEYEERMAQRRQQAPSSSSSPDAAGLPIGAVFGLVGLGAAIAGGTVLVVRRQHARPRTT